MRELGVRLFGPFQIIRGDRLVRGPVLRKAQELLALMLLAPQRNVRREQAVDTVWSAAGPDASRKAMRQALWQIHQAADPAETAASRLILTDAETVRINPERPVWLDVEEFSTAARLASATSAEALTDARLDELAAVSELYRGPLLAGCDDDWCLVERTNLEDLYLTVLDRLSTAHEQRGRPVPAIHWAQRLLEIEPAHERSHLRLMRLYYQTGDRTRALRQYQRCRGVLERELGIRPSHRTAALAAAIGAGQAADEAAAAPRMLDGFRAELAALRASVDSISDQLRSSIARG